MVVAWGSSGWRAASTSGLQYCLSLTLAGGGGVLALATGCVPGGVAVDEGGDVGVAVARRVLPAGPLGVGRPCPGTHCCGCLDRTGNWRAIFSGL